MNCFKKVIESIEIAKKAEQKFCCNHTVTNENVNELPEMRFFAQSRKLYVNFNPVFSYFGNPGLSKEYADRIKENLVGPFVSGSIVLCELIKKVGIIQKCQFVKQLAQLSQSHRITT